MSLYRLVYGKASHLPLEIEYKAWWAIKKLNLDLGRVGLKRFLDLNELEELRNDASLNSKISKKGRRNGMIRWWLGKISNKEIKSYSMIQIFISFQENSSRDGLILSPFINYIPMEQWNSSIQMRTKLSK